MYPFGLNFHLVGKAMPGGGEPRFAVKDVSVLHTMTSWSEFSKKLIGHLEGVEYELYQGIGAYSVAEAL